MYITTITNMKQEVLTRVQRLRLLNNRISLLIQQVKPIHIEKCEVFESIVFYNENYLTYMGNVSKYVREYQKEHLKLQKKQNSILSKITELNKIRCTLKVNKPFKQIKLELV